jgi:Arc/MetJ-type ribon-helix-helix transcriptional regulator
MRTVINISLPNKLKDIVDREVLKGNYASKSEFFRMLLRLWTEGKLAEELDESRRELTSGKGKLLRSLTELR